VLSSTKRPVQPQLRRVGIGSYTGVRPKHGLTMTVRCPWSEGSAEYLAYHDEEWGVPVHDQLRLFEFLVLEGAQAGLSWSTILAKRAGYRRAFVGFDPLRVARFTPARIAKLLNDPGIVRNRLKVESAVRNAQAFLRVQDEFGDFAAYAWRFVDGRPLQNAWRSSKHVPASTPQSDALSKDLKRRGFNFVGSTICYAFMQAVGMVNDHLVDCYRWPELGGGAHRVAS
jgi:DNA-3-methyladenine glycosylase I